MECDLISLAKTKQLTADGFHEKTEVLERIFESDHFDVFIIRCQDCGQLFADCFKEYTSGDFDDCWTFWVPVTEGDIKEIKNARELGALNYFMGEFVHARSQICWHPDGHVLWFEKGFHLAYVVFLP